MPDPAKPKGDGSERGPHSRPVLAIDYALYEHHLADADLTDDQRREILDALWSIIVTFVDLGFAVEPAEGDAPDICGKVEDHSSSRRDQDGAVLNSTDQPAAQPFLRAASDPAQRNEEL